MHWLSLHLQRIFGLQNVTKPTVQILSIGMSLTYDVTDFTVESVLQLNFRTFLFKTITKCDINKGHLADEESTKIYCLSDFQQVRKINQIYKKHNHNYVYTFSKNNLEFLFQQKRIP